jgi:ferric-dicitrate binding protein FerR (iron transport regulator)
MNQKESQHHHGTTIVKGPAVECLQCVTQRWRETTSGHDEAWEEAKRIMRIVDVREVSREKFMECIQLAEKIRKEGRA